MLPQRKSPMSMWTAPANAGERNCATSLPVLSTGLMISLGATFRPRC